MEKLYNQLFSLDVSDQRSFGVPVNVLRLMFDRPDLVEQSQLERRFQGFDDELFYRLTDERFLAARSKEIGEISDFVEDKKAQHGAFARLFGAGKLTAEEQQLIDGRKAGYEFLAPIFERSEQAVYAQYCRILDSAELVCQTLKIEAVAIPTYDEFRQAKEAANYELEAKYESAAKLVGKIHEYLGAVEFINDRAHSFYPDNAAEEFRTAFMGPNPDIEVKGMVDLAVARQGYIESKEATANFFTSIGHEMTGEVLETEAFVKAKPEILRSWTSDETAKVAALTDYRSCLIKRDGVADVATINRAILELSDNPTRDIQGMVEGIKAQLEARSAVAQPAKA